MSIKTRVLLLLCFVLVMFQQVGAVPITLREGGGANGNLHNLSSLATHGGIRAASTAGGTTEICKFCHTPHGASTQSTLWNRPDPDTMGNFPLFNRTTSIAIYNSATIAPQAQYGSGYGEYPNGATKMCLSCHDGVTSIGTLVDGTVISMQGGVDTITGVNKYFNADGSGNAADFSKTHPVSFYYTSSIASAIDTYYGGGGNYYKFPAAGDRDVLDGVYRVQCTTCHDPHYDTRDAANGYNLPFWRKYTGDANEATDYDTVCNACHVGDYNPPGTHNL